MRISKSLDVSSHSNKRQVLIDMAFTNDEEVQDRVGFIADAAELDTIIDNLAKRRAELEPAFPRQLERPAFRNVTRKTVVFIGPPNAASQEVAIAFLHPGLGWLCFPLSLEAAKNISIQLMQHVTQKMSRAPIIGPDGKPL